MTKAICLFASTLVLMAAVTPVFAVENPPSDKVLQSLQVAFNSENNAKVRYEAFALRADQDGYGQIASLFRTAAKAEGFHARNFSTEINRLGGTQLGETDSPTVKSTKENLEAAIQAETYERDIMYPEFRQVAQNLYQMDAVRTINFAYNGEVSHVILLTEAYSNLETKLGTHNTYYVCSECGYTTKDAPKSACHACYSAEEKFTKVS